MARRSRTVQIGVARGVRGAASSAVAPVLHRLRALPLVRSGPPLLQQALLAHGAQSVQTRARPELPAPERRAGRPRQAPALVSAATARARKRDETGSSAGGGCDSGGRAGRDCEHLARAAAPAGGGAPCRLSGSRSSRAATRRD